MKKIICMLFILIATYSNAFCDAEKKEKNDSKDEIILAMTDLPPYRIVRDDKVEGIFIDIFKEIIRPMNLEIKPLVTPFKRCLLYLEQGKADVYIGLFRRPEREKFIYFVEPPFQTKTVKAFYLRKGEGHRIQNYEDIYSLKKAVGIRAGFKNFPRFDNDEKIQKEGVPTDEQNFKKLSAERIDAFLHTEEVADYLIATLGYAGHFEKAPYKPDLPNPAYIAISKKSPFIKLAGEFEDSVKHLVGKGKIEEIKKDYFRKLIKVSE